MEECARLNGKTIAGMDWSQVTPVLYTVNVPKEQNTDDNPSDVAAGEDGFVRSCYGGSSAGSFSLAFKDLGRGGERFHGLFPAIPSFFFLSGESARAHQFHFQARSTPQWLSELRRLWPSAS